MKYSVNMALIKDQRVGDKPKVLYHFLLSTVNEDGVCVETNESIASSLGCTTRTVRNAIEDLIRFGYAGRVVIGPHREISL